MDHITQFLVEVSNNPKAAVVTAGTTAAVGISTAFEKLPTYLGPIATVIGIVLSSVLIYNHVKKGRLERKKLKLEIRELQNKLNCN